MKATLCERNLLIISHSYQLASRLQDRLDEMGKDLSGMIEEINDASSTLSKNNKADDPVSLFSPVRSIMKFDISGISFHRSSASLTATSPSCSRLIKVLLDYRQKSKKLKE